MLGFPLGVCLTVANGDRAIVSSDVPLETLIGWFPLATISDVLCDIVVCNDIIGDTGSDLYPVAPPTGTPSLLLPADNGGGNENNIGEDVKLDSVLLTLLSSDVLSLSINGGGSVTVGGVSCLRGGVPLLVGGVEKLAQFEVVVDKVVLLVPKDASH